MVPLSEEVADVYSLFNSLLKGASNRSSHSEAGTRSRALTQNNKRGKVASSAQGRGRCTVAPPWRTEPWASAVCFSLRAKAHFFLQSQRLCTCCSPNSSHSSSAFTQARLKPAVLVTRAQCGTLFECFPRKLVHLAISLNSQLTATLLVKAHLECLYIIRSSILVDTPHRWDPPRVTLS